MDMFILANLLQDDEACVAFLQQRGIIHNQRQCTNGHAMAIQYRNTGSDHWRCRICGCREEVGVKKGTWLEQSKLPYRTVPLFIYSWAYEMMSIEFCERELHINKNTVVDWNNYLREVCATDLIQNPMRIGGPNMTVEVDESLFTRRKNHQGRFLPQQWVFGGICREIRETFQYAVDRRDVATLLPIIQGSILPGTTIMSDLWAAYGGIQQIGYTHHTVNHTYHFVDPVTGAHTQNVENSWKNAKTRNKKQHGTNRGMLDSYLCEWMWRQRNRNLNNNLFDKMLVDISVYFPPQ